MSSLRFVYHKDYNFNRGLPFVRQVHGFVLNKPGQIRAALVDQGVAKASQFESPGRLQEDELRAIHSEEVVSGWRSGKAIAAAGEFPPLAMLPSFISRHILVKPQLRASAGTQLALAGAMQGDWVFNLSGGFHHARKSLAHGFCLMNDVAWGVHCLHRAGHSPRVLVLDLDLHQGDGNVDAFEKRADVFTASLHQGNTFPEPKLEGDLDLALEGGEVDDDGYLRATDQLLADIAARFDPEIVVYVAGTDPYRGDAIGDFNVSADALAERDRRVARFTLDHGAGLVVLPAGGYSAESPSISAAGYAAMAAEFRAN